MGNPDFIENSNCEEDTLLSPIIKRVFLNPNPVNYENIPRLSAIPSLASTGIRFSFSPDLSAAASPAVAPYLRQQRLVTLS